MLLAHTKCSNFLLLHATLVSVLFILVRTYVYCLYSNLKFLNLFVNQAHFITKPVDVYYDSHAQ